MRASESGSVAFHDVRLGPDGVRDAFPAGEYSVRYLDRFLAAGAFHAAASLGIAESAQARIVQTLTQRTAAVQYQDNVAKLQRTFTGALERGRCSTGGTHRRIPARAPGGGAASPMPRLSTVRFRRRRLTSTRPEPGRRSGAGTERRRWLHGEPPWRRPGGRPAGAFMVLGAIRLRLPARTALGARRSPPPFVRNPCYARVSDQTPVTCGCGSPTGREHRREQCRAQHVVPMSYRCLPYRRSSARPF